MIRRILLILLLLNGAQTFAFSKIELRVLYVGYDGDRPMPANVVYYSTSAEVVAKLYPSRMEDFSKFLNERFAVVQCVDVRNYTPALSEQFDVTIMDAGPVQLPADFNRPMILMHAMAPNIGLPLGLKFDWYCQCLDGEALNIKTSHDIFNTPNKVKLTMVKKPTPGSFFNGWQAKKTPKEMSRWAVLKQGFSSGEGYLIGMVSHGEGFNDSPDAEVISGGVCLKNAEAVALGRQGNYFMWGFSGSPDFMTGEARDVFVNAICYIQKFDRMPAIVKKVQIETREGIEERIYRIDKKLYNAAIISRREGNARLLKLQQELKDKKAKGEDIGKGNEMFLKMPVTNEMESFEDYLKTQAGPELFARFGTNVPLYHKYFRDNYEYFYPSGTYSLQLDTDAQKLGISNRKIDILDKCIALLEQHQDTELAQRVLERYTTEKFKTGPEWKKWLMTNREKLFYTESGGFKFMVNTFGKVAASKAPVEVFSGDMKPSSQDPVAVSARIEYTKDTAKANLILSAAILKGWHIYAYVSKENPFIPTETILELPNGVKTEGEWETSPALPFPGTEGVYIFEGNATFKIGLDLSGLQSGAILKCGLSYQTCDETKCLPPGQKTVQLKF